MNVSSELSKIKNSFFKVRNDMGFLSKKITENYENFTNEHNKLIKKVESISEKLKIELSNLKIENLHPKEHINEIKELKSEIKELKFEVKNTHNEHINISNLIDDIKKNKTNINEMKNRLNSSELEICLLKEKLNDKDKEIVQLKDISKHLFDLINELSKAEIKLLNKSMHQKIK